MGEWISYGLTSPFALSIIALGFLGTGLGDSVKSLNASKPCGRCVDVWPGTQYTVTRFEGANRKKYSSGAMHFELFL
jgi:hypothetical protein